MSKITFDKRTIELLKQNQYVVRVSEKSIDKVKPVGRKPIGYSLTRDNNKICDDEIKDYIIEGINGDA